MNLSRIEIQNFRNFRKISVQFQEALNVLVGPNNVGKTNLFDAIRHALGPAASRSEPLWLQDEDRFREPTGEDAAESLEIRLEFANLNDDDRAQFFEIIDFRENEPIEESRARINFEAVWNEELGRFKVARWGGGPEGERTAIPTEIIAALPLIFLPALRDAEAALTPGNRSVLARVLHDLAKRDTSDNEERLEEIFKNANKELEEDDLIKKIEGRLRKGTEKMAGADYQAASVRAASPDFRRILRTLRLVLDEAPVADLASSGLGYSNLLYMAAILSHLEQPLARECPILLVEEPEAHLSPQLTVLLGEYLSTLEVPQVIVNTHSPTFAANVRPSQVLILTDYEDEQRCIELRGANFSRVEERQLQRMLDITRATLYFAKGLILVEGISESLLVPELAKLIGINLAEYHISVLPICGVSFKIFEKLFSPDIACIPVSIITDTDPPVASPGDSWRNDVPDFEKKSDRLEVLEDTFDKNDFVKVCPAAVTLEYDLAVASGDNAVVMAEVWEGLFKKRPGTLTAAEVAAMAEVKEKALCVWRGICRSQTSGSKADFANLLADRISQVRAKQEESKGATLKLSQAGFAVPDYIVRAIQHVVPQSVTVNKT